MGDTPRLHFYEGPDEECRIEVVGGEFDGEVLLTGKLNPVTLARWPGIWHAIAGRYNTGVPTECEGT